MKTKINNFRTSASGSRQVLEPESNFIEPDAEVSEPGGRVVELASEVVEVESEINSTKSSSSTTDGGSSYANSDYEVKNVYEAAASRNRKAAADEGYDLTAEDYYSDDEEEIDINITSDEPSGAEHFMLHTPLYDMAGLLPILWIVLAAGVASFFVPLVTLGATMIALLVVGIAAVFFYTGSFKRL